MIFNFSTREKIRLDEYLRRHLEEQAGAIEFSNSKLRRLIISGSVSVNGMQVRRPAFELRGFSQITVDFDEEKFFYEKQPDDIKFEVTEESVLFEDEYLICINKPAFFPVEETVVGSQKRDNLHDAVVRYLWAKNPGLRNPPYCGIMHRLDRETSGVILFTKQRSVNRQISEMFSSHDFQKIYKAVTVKKMNFLKSSFVEGTEKKFTVEMPMNRISSKSQKGKWGFVPEQKGGQNSKTSFKLLEEKNMNGQKVSVFEADLFTGRTHQIRVHLSEAGFPILGDELYGGNDYSRIMLHACKLEFVHPVNGEKLVVEAPCDF